jgi:hypothetical protein
MDKMKEEVFTKRRRKRKPKKADKLAQLLAKKNLGNN